jgi:hypothetical protein
MRHVIFLFLFLISFQSYSQTKKDTSITWISYPCYDSVGNVTYYKKIFNYVPTKKDTLKFGHHIDTAQSNAINRAINATLDTLRKKGYLKPKK